MEVPMIEKSHLALPLAGLVLAGAACFNSPHNNVVEADHRFELTTASVVLGGRQLLVDTSNGDVWMLEGERAPGARWVLLARGPEDLREPARPEISRPQQTPEEE
jgi:hypothetical protein